MNTSKHLTLPARFRRWKGDRYQCQFKDHPENGFTTDCAFDDLDMAMSFVSLVIRFLPLLQAGQVLDSKSQQVVFSCMRSDASVQKTTNAVREAPADYAQLVMTGFDAKSTSKANHKCQKKVEETLAKLRQLHDELNAQLYTHPAERPCVHSPADVFNILKCFLSNLDHEELWIVNMDTRNRVMSLVQLYKGSVNSSQVRIAEVFRQAIVDNSPAIILAHNHRAPRSAIL